jgi:hypothetical protein
MTTPEARAAAEYVRQHPGCIQSNVIEHIMGGRSYGWAYRRVKQAIDAGLIKARREGTELRLYPGEGRS